MAGGGAAALAGRRMADHAGEALRAAMQAAGRDHPGADRMAEFHEEEIAGALTGAMFEFAERHHLRAAARPAWRLEAQGQFRFEVEAAPGAQSVERDDAEGVAVIRIGENRLRQSQAHRPDALL